MKARFLTVPNTLTLFRAVSALVFLVFWFGFAGEDLRNIRLWACLVVACLSEASDLLDGWLARRWKQVSTFGKLMDPYADSIFRLTVLLCFASPPHGPWYPLWMPILLVLRDIGTSIIRTFGMEQGIVVAARFWGKAKAVVQGVVMIALLVLALARTRIGVLEGLDFVRDATIMMAIVVAVAWWSLATYFWAHVSVFSKAAPGQDEKP